MAVYERTYRPYRGTLTPGWSRFLVIPRYAYAEVFRSKLFAAFLVACFVWPLALAVVIYLPHNLSFLKLLRQGVGGIQIDFNAAFFLRVFLFPQAFLAFVMTFVVGPALISVDLRNNALPLYLVRPFTRWEYLAGKALVLVNLLSLVTWVPGLALFFLHGALTGEGWLVTHARIGVAIGLSSALYIGLLCLVSLALSAYVKWKPLARLGLFGVFVLAAGLAQILNNALRTKWGSLIDLAEMMRVVWASLFGVPIVDGVPATAAWAALLTASAACIGLLARKVRAYEIVK